MMSKKPTTKKPAGKPMGYAKGGAVKKPAKAPAKPMGYAKGGMVKKGKC